MLLTDKINKHVVVGILLHTLEEAKKSAKEVSEERRGELPMMPQYELVVPFLLSDENSQRIHEAALLAFGPTDIDYYRHPVS